MQPTNLNAGRYFTVDEVADRVRLSRMTVYRLIHSGDLPALRVGRSFRIPEAVVETYLASCLTTAELSESTEQTA